MYYLQSQILKTLFYIHPISLHPLLQTRGVILWSFASNAFVQIVDDKVGSTNMASTSNLSALEQLKTSAADSMNFFFCPPSFWIIWINTFSFDDLWMHFHFNLLNSLSFSISLMWDNVTFWHIKLQWTYEGINVLEDFWSGLKKSSF